MGLGFGDLGFRVSTPCIGCSTGEYYEGVL